MRLPEELVAARTLAHIDLFSQAGQSVPLETGPTQPKETLTTLSPLYVRASTFVFKIIIKNVLDTSILKVHFFVNTNKSFAG